MSEGEEYYPGQRPSKATCLKSDYTPISLTDQHSHDTAIICPPQPRRGSAAPLKIHNSGSAAGTTLVHGCGYMVVGGTLSAKSIAFTTDPTMASITSPPVSPVSQPITTAPRLGSPARFALVLSPGPSSFDIRGSSS